MQNDTIPGEEWRPVVGFEGLYEVSNHGRVRSLARLVPARGQADHPVRARMRKLALTANGYLSVSLWKKNKHHGIFVHVLVLEAFTHPRPPGMQVAHWDGVRTNNRLENLRWATRSENERDRVRHGTSNRGERCAAAKLTANDVRQIRAQIGVVPGWKLAKQFKVSQTAISHIKTRTTWGHLE